MRTAECVTPMHPDKLCDRISDAILDACLSQDPMARVAIETMGGHGIITITGELTMEGWVDMRAIAQSVAGKQYGVQVNVVQQSPEIANGVDTGGAGDQGIMIGYACDDNEAMIPQELYLSRTLAQAIYAKYPYDGKTQITLNDDGTINTIVASFQNTTEQQLLDLIMDWFPSFVTPENAPTIYCNPAGNWNIGGFEADTGLTGRKLMVDNYGPQIPIGGGCFSGKDSTKVDRSAAYMARKIAVHYLKTFPEAKNITCKLAYAIGVRMPVMATVQLGTGETIDLLLAGTRADMTTLTPKGIIEELDLRKPQFAKTAEWGHFGNGFTWDK